MTPKTDKYCVVDAGNTQIKIVDFENEQFVRQQTVAINEEEKLRKILSSRKKATSLLSSVLDNKTTSWIARLMEPNLILNSNTPLPIDLKQYETPETLGADRIANAVAAHHFSSTEQALVVDVGTCIKFDLVVKGKYQGGSISPGYKMRLRAMHDYTGALPYLELENVSYLIGKNTKQAMLSGVINGIQAEIHKFIDVYAQQYQQLTIFLTGGDHKIFDKELKNSIFADDNLTIKGLFIILRHNV